MLMHLLIRLLQVNTDKFLEAEKKNTLSIWAPKSKYGRFLNKNSETVQVRGLTETSVKSWMEATVNPEFDA